MASMKPHTEPHTEPRIDPYLEGLLTAQYGEALTARIAQGYAGERAATLRINPLRGEREHTRAELSAAGIAAQGVPWYEDALILTGAREDAVTALPLYARGAVYMQSLSSMIPALLLGAQAGENVLDMAAAPGGKTTQIAALTMGGAMITACEKNRIRAERLKFNIERQGAPHVTVMTADAATLDDLFRFDRILLDAPCSGSGTVQLGNPRSRGRFNAANLQKTTKAQAALLQKALRLLRPGCEMVYSTCSILEQENEAIVRRALGAGAQIVPLDLSGMEDVPTLPTRLPGTLCVMPTQLYEGFFVAKIRKTK